MSRLSIVKTLPLALLAFACLCAFSLLPSALSVVAVDLAADAKLLTQLDDAWSKAAGTKDLEAVASYYADDAVAYPPNEPVAVGRPAAKRVWAAYLALPDFAISWKTVHAEAAPSGDLGYTAGTYELSFKVADQKSVAEKGKYVCIWKKQKDGNWKAVHDIWNSDAK